MSVQSAKISNSVEFERREAHLSDDDTDGPPYTIHGVALGENDITFGTSGIKKVWPAGELERSAHTLQNTNLVVDHSQRAVDVVGKVTKAGYKDGVGIIYEAELYDEDLADKVQHGLLEVSIRGYHIDVDEMSEDDNGAKIVEDIEFDNLSIVPQGASPSNTLEMGAHAELSAAELIAFTETLDVATLAVSEPGQWVKWEDNRGITVSMPSDGEIDVDVYQQFDDTWRSTGEVKTVSVDSLSEWDVDEDDVGSEADKEEAVHGGPFHIGQIFYSPMNDEMIEIVDIEGDRARMRDEDGDTWYKTYDSIMGRLDDEVWIMAPSKVEIGDTFRSAVNGGMVRITERERGQALVQAVDSPDSTWWDRVVDIEEKIRDGAWEPVDTQSQMGYAEMAPTEDFMFDSEDEAMEIVESDEFNILTGVHSHDMDGKTVWMPGNDMDEFNRWHSMKHAGDDMSSYASFYDADELGRSNVAQYDVEADQWVQWYPSETTEKHGFATNVSDDKVTIEVWTQLSDGTWKADGDTVTKSMDEVEPWGNFPRKQEDFAIEGEDPRRAVRPSEEASNGLSEQTETALRNKVKSHNEEYGDKDGKRVTYRMLKSVYNRGGGAYDDSHREGMSRQQWSMARVNAFLYLVRNGNPENDSYVQDNDLLPDGHPKRTEEAAIDAPEFHDDQVVYWQVNPDMMGKVVHVDESRDIVMVEIIEEEDGMYMPSGFTVSAGYSDIMPFGADSMNAESLETRYDDYPKAAQENAQMALDAREDTGNPNDCGTDVGWLRARQLADGRGVTREQLGKMSAFARHRQNAEMDPDEGRADCGWMMWKAWGGDEGVDWAQRKLEQIEEDNMEYDELQDYDFHDVNYDGTTEESWDAPTLEQIMDAYGWSDEYDSYDDLPESAKETIGDHFLISMSGFPAENFGDYKLPVVDLEGRLSVRALSAAKGGRGVSRVSGLSDDMEETIVEYINELANDEFDRDWGMEEAAYNDMMMEEYMYETPEEAMEAGEEMGLEGVHMHGEMYCPGETHQDLMDAVASMGMYGDDEMDEEEEMSQAPRADSMAVLTSDDLRRRYKSEESELDSLTTAKIINMSNITEELQAALEELEAPVAVEQADLESLQEKASKYDDISEDISELRERTEVLDDVERELIEELAEAEEPLVIESARYETLSDEAEHVKTIYAEGLSDELGLFEPEELMERFSIEELREKFDEHVGDIDEELSPAPKAGDAAEEELEAKAEDTKSEEELSLEDEVRSKQQELREKIFQ